MKKFYKKVDDLEMVTAGCKSLDCDTKNLLICDSREDYLQETQQQVLKLKCLLNSQKAWSM